MIAARFPRSGQHEWVSADSRTSRAVSRNRGSRVPGMSGVRPDRFDHEVESVGAVDLACDAVGHVGPDASAYDFGDPGDEERFTAGRSSVCAPDDPLRVAKL